MSDPTPVDLSDLQLMPDWLKGGAGKAKPGSGESPKGKGRSARDAGDNRKKGSAGGKKIRGNFEQRGRSDNRNRRHLTTGTRGGDEMKKATVSPMIPVTGATIAPLHHHRLRESVLPCNQVSQASHSWWSKSGKQHGLTRFLILPA